MKVIEYTTELFSDGHFTIPRTMLQDMNLQTPKTVRVLVIKE